MEALLNPFSLKLRAFWHWQHMPVGSVRPLLLTKRLVTRRFIPVTGRPQDFVLQAAVASDISDAIAKGRLILQRHHACTYSDNKVWFSAHGHHK